MKSELIIDVRSDEVAIALTEDERLQEVNHEKRGEDTFAVGNIYYGRVRKVMPALNAVFVDVGHEKEAFLHFLDLGEDFQTMQKYVTRAVSDRRHIPDMRRQERFPKVPKEGKIGDYLNVGDTLLVQVTKEPINTKGPRVSAELSITGRNFVLIPFSDRIMVSNKIKRDGERNRLKQLVQSVKPQGFGVIIRTVAEGKELSELENELKVLAKRWDDCIRTLQKCQPVSLVSEDLGRTLGILRDMYNPNFENIYVNDPTTHEQIVQYLELIAPGAGKVVHLYQGEQPIFDKFDITSRMKKGLGRTVGFKDGGYLIIERTEALFSIDVNSGSKKLFENQEQNALHYNLLAADEIVHQLRLRDIGGIIIVDFIDMDDKENQQTLYEHVRKLMSRDRARHNVLPLSKFGLMQITRQRVRPAVEMDVTETCPTCQGKGRVQPTILFTDRIAEQLEMYVSQFGKGLRLQLHPYVYAYVKRGFPSLSLRWRLKYGVIVRENQSLSFLETRVLSLFGKELTLENQTPVEVTNNAADRKKEPAPTTLREEKKQAILLTSPQPQVPVAPKKDSTPKKDATPKKDVTPKKAVTSQKAAAPRKKTAVATPAPKAPAVAPAPVPESTILPAPAAPTRRKKTAAPKAEVVVPATQAPSPAPATPAAPTRRKKTTAPKAEVVVPVAQAPSPAPATQAAAPTRRKKTAAPKAGVSQTTDTPEVVAPKPKRAPRRKSKTNATSNSVSSSNAEK